MMLPEQELQSVWMTAVLSVRWKVDGMVALLASRSVAGLAGLLEVGLVDPMAVLSVASLVELLDLV